MANTLARMTRDGLVTSRPDPADGRSRLMALTPRGEERAQQGLAAARAVNALALEALTKEEVPLFLDMIRRVVGKLESGNHEWTVDPGVSFEDMLSSSSQRPSLTNV